MWREVTEAEFATFATWLRTQGRVSRAFTPSDKLQLAVPDVDDEAFVPAALYGGMDGEWFVRESLAGRAGL